MDGGSTDETPAILERYAAQLTHLESAKDGGQADAVVRGFAAHYRRNHGVLNSDDVLAPGALEFVAQFFDENPSVDAVYSHRVFMREDGIVDAYWILPPAFKCADEALGLYPAGDLLLATADLRCRRRYRSVVSIRA